MKGLCQRCGKREFHSKMVGGTTCLNCHEKNLQIGKTSLKVLSLFDSVYNFTPIIAGIMGFLYLIISPTDYSYFVFFVFSIVVFSIVCLLGMFPSIIVTLSMREMQELMRLLEIEKGKYEFEGVATCYNHPKRDAVAVCSMCFKPYCEADFQPNFQKFTYCRACASKYFGELNLLSSIIAIGPLSFLTIVALYFDFTFGFGFLSVIPLAFLLIIVGVVLVMYNWKRQAKSD